MAERSSSLVSASSEALAVNVPLLGHEDSSFPHPRPPFASVNGEQSPRGSFVEASPTRSSSGMFLATKNEAYIEDERSAPAASASSRRRPLLTILAALLILVVVVLAVIIPVYFTVIRPRHDKSTLVGTSPSSNPSNGPTAASGSPGAKPTPAAAEAITGGDGSTIKASDGSTFTYSNKFGGVCEFCVFLFFQNRRGT